MISMKLNGILLRFIEDCYLSFDFILYGLKFYLNNRKFSKKNNSNHFLNNLILEAAVKGISLKDLRVFN